MTRTSFESDPSLNEQDSALADAVEEITQRIATGEPIHGDDLCSRYPTVAAQIRELLPIMTAVGEHAQSSADGSCATLIEVPTTVPGVLGDFRILRELGRGGMGIVYEAEQISLQRHVALKVLPFAGLLKDHQLQRFHNEARAAAMLKHPHIVSVHFVGSDRGVHYYAMELIRGRTLELKDEGGRMKDESEKTGNDPSLIHPSSFTLHPSSTSPIAAITTQPDVDRKSDYRSIAELGVQAAEALQYAHQQGVIHRDIKPSNLLLDHAGNLHVTDFGLARILSSEHVTLSGNLVGTLRYASPEQLSTELVVDHRTDIYSLGLTLYELYAKQPAFTCQEREPLMRQVLEQDPKPLSQLDPQIPIDLETIITRATAKERELRYQTAQDLADDLRRYLENRPILARPTSRLEKLWRWYRRSPQVAALSLAVVLLLLFVTGSALWFAQRESAQRQVAEHNAAESHWQQYLSDMYSAMAAWEQSNIGRTLELLERHQPKKGEPDLRGFEWNYLWRQCHVDPPLVTINERSLVWGMEFSHDGRMLATGNGSGLRLWQSDSGQLIHEFDGHHVIAACVAFSPDDKILAVADLAGVIDLWDLETRSSRRVLKGPYGDIMSLVFSSDGKRLASGHEDHAIRIWDVATGTELRTIRPRVLDHPVPLVPQDPWDGQRIWVAALDGRLLLFDTDSGDELRTIRREGLSVSNSGSLAMSDDGRQAATGGRDGVIRLVDVETGHELGSLGAQSGSIKSLVFAPGNRTLASSDNDGRIVLWDVKTRRPQKVLRGHSGPVRYLAFSHDGQRLCSHDVGYKMQIWDVARQPSTNDELRGHWEKILSVAFSPDGRTIASGGAESLGGRVMLWDAATGRQEAIFSGHTNWIWHVAFSPDGLELASAGIDGTVRIWDLTRRTERLTIRTTENEFLSWNSFSRDGREVVCANNHGTIRVWDRVTGMLLRMVQLDKDEGVYRPALSPDGRFIATAANGEIVLLDFASLKIVRRFPLTLGEMWSAAFSRDGKVLAYCGANSVALFALDSGTVVGTLDHAHRVLGVDFSPDGRTLVTGDIVNQVHLWDIEHLDRRVTLRGHDSNVQMVRFSPDGKTIASASTDSTIRVWRGDPQE